MIMKKFNEANYISIFTIIILLIIIVASINILDAYNFLCKIDLKTKTISVQDVIIYIVYGINDNYGINLIDILRFSIPYILVAFFIGTYLTNMIESSNKYLYLIRYKNYKTWLGKNLINLFLLVVLIFTAYYLLLIIISFMFIKNNFGFTEIFYTLNPFYNNSNSFLKLLMYQYLISISLGASIISIQLLLTLLFKDSNKSFTLISVVIIVFTFLGKWNVYNPFMMCKHILINSTCKIHPLTTINANVIITTLIYLFVIKTIKYIVRRIGI